MKRVRTWRLFAVCVLTWGTTWHAITYQIGVNSPEVGVALRFGMAGLALLAWCAWQGQRLRFALRDHALLALQGSFMYGVAYVCVYHAEQHVPSGLVAVGYSASPLIAGLGAQALFGVAVTRRFVCGGLLGLTGVALMFWPEFGKASLAGAGGSATSLGAALTVASVLLSAVGSLAASRNRSRGLPLWPSLGFGMVYGATAAAVLAGLQGHTLTLPSLPSWWLSLFYLALAGSVMAFACFLTLQDRVGPGPASTVGVMTPLLALVVSLLFESYRPGWITGIGVLLAVAGNVMMVRPATAGTVRPASAAAAAE